MVSRAAWLYTTLVVCSAIAVVAVTPLATATVPRYWLMLGVLQLLFLICDSTPTPLAARQSAWSPSSSATLAAVVLLGPAGAALVGAVAVLSRRPQLPVAQRLFNGAMHALSGYLAGQTFVLLQHSYPAGHHFGVPQPDYFPVLLVPFAAAAVVHVLANHVLIWGVLRANRGRGAASGQAVSGQAVSGQAASGQAASGQAASGQAASGQAASGQAASRPPVRSRQVRSQAAMESSLPLLLVSDLGFAALGLIIAALWGVMHEVAAVIVLVPLFVARWAMGQFAEQQRAYAATMAALCQAVETKDFYTRGHSDRVSRGSGMIARQINMRPERAEALTFAGMLHDVGKLGVPTKVLQKTGPLTEEEYAAIQLHPMRGLEIVREIGFLNEALAGIMHHHERIDGRGYPMGFAGDEIPEFARVIAVADAFDSITSNRSYRKARTIAQGVEELRRGAGSQFDPGIVDAFIAALARDGWMLPDSEDAPPDGEMVTAQDHDDPTAPLRVIESA
jgi:hypothetical protein